MPLFDVPGWTVDAPPIAEAVKTSKKRKRSAVEPHDLQAAEANFETLIKQLDRSSSTDNLGAAPKKKEKKEKKKKATKDITDKRAVPAQLPRKILDQSHPSSPHSKKTKKKHAREYSQSVAGLTLLQKEMKESLDGARFRMINESLYKSDSSQAYKMMREDPRVFEDYHAGFRHQVQSWPTNPVEHYITVLSTYPQKTFIADLGCGDATMARALIPKGLSVVSFDLVSDGAFVVEADICTKIPLPGSEPTREERSEGEGHIVDVVVCALSLMGTNWPKCLREAWRILKPGGELKIAEVASRLTDVERFQKLVASIGFRLNSKDATNSHFTLFEFKKVASKGKSEEEWGEMLLKANLLQPCEYKRR
ncbi:hypothetical protein C0989_012361 [Termitomyces sp. Mn162]|nr:hypothetical protein C0989_012361 [Termitomyces sp. Mn162]KAH0587288.1 hypothetical protein H2248_006091 [Termitomyces sp. 'cryptogamus']